MISRRTIIFFFLSLAFCGLAAFRARQYDRPCREWKLTHPSSQSEPTNTQQSDGTTTVSFGPCDLAPETSPIDKVIALLAFVSLVAFWILLLQDIVRGVRRRLRPVP